LKQIVFVSGKGGTGKSTIVASLSLLVAEKMLADCDVDAPNLHLLVKGERIRQKDYSGAKIARINLDQCVNCGTCREACRFDAINEDYSIKPLACEGCAACQVQCPTGAVDLIPVKTGETFVTETIRGTFAHAQLEIGAEGSGKLVTEVRKSLNEYQQDEDWVLIDGSPGIGCPVIASITGTDAVVAVTEPTLSGRHDLDRVLAIADHFQVPAFVCINKYDLNLEITQDIIADCRLRGVQVIGQIRFEPEIVKALQQGLTPVEANLQDIVSSIRTLWQELAEALIQN
jgi:MinD superfamily P-loop ATPase